MWMNFINSIISTFEAPISRNWRCYPALLDQIISMFFFENQIQLCCSISFELIERPSLENLYKSNKIEYFVLIQILFINKKIHLPERTNKSIFFLIGTKKRIVMNNAKFLVLHFLYLNATSWLTDQFQFIVIVPQNNGGKLNMSRREKKWKKVK